MRRFSVIAFVVVSTLLAAATVLQLYLAGVGVFSDPTDGLFAVHGWNGRIVLPLLVLLTILFAALAKAGKRTVYRLAQSGEIPAFKLGGTWRFRRSELDRWIAAKIASAGHKKSSTR